MDFRVKGDFLSPNPNPPRNDCQVHEPLNLRARFFCPLGDLGPGNISLTPEASSRRV